MCLVNPWFRVAPTSSQAQLNQGCDDRSFSYSHPGTTVFLFGPPNLVASQRSTVSGRRRPPSDPCNLRSVVWLHPESRLQDQQITADAQGVLTVTAKAVTLWLRALTRVNRRHCVSPPRSANAWKRPAKMVALTNWCWCPRPGFSA